jgi:EAL domain-containing protein (putative c-di-GMP-specific phosphodiesterase class I)
VIALADELGLAVVAEGVETHEQLEALRAMGCPFAQGYLFARARPAKRFFRAAPSGERSVAAAIWA